MDYGLLPPEINSGLMYTGPGPGSMSEAAAAWDSLAVELRSTADSYPSILSTLAAGWRGPSAMRMEMAATPYAAWLRGAAARAEQAATQAKAAIDAYQTAFTATVPPPVVAANRRELASLIATNTLGQNTQAITAAETQYAQMWAQDAAAMYHYAGSSAAATQLVPFAPPPQTTNPAGVTSQHSATVHAAAASAGNAQPVLSQLAALMSGVPSALGNAATSGQMIPPGIALLLQPLRLSSFLSLTTEALGTLLRGLTTSGTALVTTIFGMNLSMLWMQAAMSPIATSAALSPAAAAELISDAGTATPTVSARFGSTVLAGRLSVPPSWAVATPTAKLVASALQSTSASAVPTAATKGVDGMFSQMTHAGLAGGVLGRAIPSAINVTSVRRADTVRNKDDSKPSKFERVLAELSQKPESVQHWHTDKAQLEALLDQLSKTPGTHAVHIHPEPRSST